MTEPGAMDKKVVGTHKGPVTAVHIMRPEDGKVGEGLVLSGSADMTIRVSTQAPLGVVHR